LGRRATRSPCHAASTTATEHRGESDASASKGSPAQARFRSEAEEAGLSSALFGVGRNLGAAFFAESAIGRVRRAAVWTGHRGHRVGRRTFELQAALLAENAVVRRFGAALLA
jgi:hypothetical protein